MPKSMSPDDPDTDAALSAWEEGQGASAPDHADPTYQALRRAFLHHPDVEALDAAIAAARRTCARFWSADSLAKQAQGWLRSSERGETGTGIGQGLGERFKKDVARLHKKGHSWEEIGKYWASSPALPKTASIKAGTKQSGTAQRRRRWTIRTMKHNHARRVKYARPGFHLLFRGKR